MFGCLLAWYTIYTLSGSLAPWRNFCQVQNSLCVHLRTIAQVSRAISSQLRHLSTIGKKLTKQQYLLKMSSQYREVQPTDCWGRLASLGHPSKFQRVWCLGFVTARTLFNGGQSNFGRCLAVSWAGTLYIYFLRLFSSNGILRRRTEGATYIRQGGHQVGHWPTFLVSKGFLVEQVKKENQVGSG